MTRNTASLLAAGMGTALGLLLAADAAAQPAPADEANQAGAAQDDGDDIVVTARRREERAQDVPVAFSVVDARTLEATGSHTLAQVQQLVPTLQLFSPNPRNTNVNIRGLGSNVALINDGLESGVGVYIDNVYYGRLGQSQFDLVDLERIEVLRGPQGTLFGKNTTAGAINVTSRAPSFEPEFSGEASIGDHGYRQLRGSVSAPLAGDSVAFRLSLADTHRGGFLTNVVTGRKAQDYDNFTARGQLLIRPADTLSIRLIGDYSSQKQKAVLGVLAAVHDGYADGTPIPNSFRDRAARAGYTPLPVDPFARRGEADSPYQANMEGYGVSGQLDWDFDGATLTAITAWRWWDWDPLNDADFTALPIITKGHAATEQRQFSQEVRLASTGARTIDYVAGAYYFRQLVRGSAAFAYGPAAANWNIPIIGTLTPALSATVGNAALNGFEANSIGTPETHSYAAFGQATWNIGGNVKLTGGLRYTYERKHGEYRQFHVAGADLSILPAPLAAAAAQVRNTFNPVTSYATRFEDGSLSGLLTLAWNVGPDALAYATYSRGGKSGGLNLSSLPAGVDPEVEPEKVDNFEIGLKSRFLDRRLTLNLAGFWTEVRDFQAQITEQAPNTVNFRTYIDNIPRVRSRGFEADVAYAPSRHFRLTGAIAYTDAIYRDYRNAPQAPENLNKGSVQDLTGARLSGVPKFTYTLGADAEQPLAGALVLYGRADFSHRSSFNTSANNSAWAQIPGYGVLNVRLGVRTDDGRWDLSVWARNLTDTDYFLMLSPAVTGAVIAQPGEPRTIGATLRTKF